MEFWPTNFQVNLDVIAKTKWKIKETFKSNDFSIRAGSLGATTLTTRKTEAQPQWITLVNTRSKSVLQRISQPVEIFPSTRAPPLSVSELTVHQQAQQGAHFLHAYRPDVNIPFDIIKEGFRSDKEEMAAEALLDPYAGNSLTYLNWQSKRVQAGHFVAFPSGSTSSELNVSPFIISKGKTTFNPSVEPVVKFQTPILQLGAFNTDLIMERYSYLAVRTHATIDVVKLQDMARPEAEYNPFVTADIALTIKTTETGNARVVDMSCGLRSNLKASLLLVNNAGVLYDCRFDCSRKPSFSLCDNPRIEDSELDAFWRISQNGNDECVRISGKKAHLLDFRARNGMPQEIFSLLGSHEYITSLEVGGTLEHLVSFSTTKKLLWYDARNFGRPILSLKHQRAFDRSLRMRSVSMGSHAFVTLSSSRNDLVTIYDITRLASGHNQLNSIPSILFSSASLDIPITGSLLLPHLIHDDQGCSLVQLSSRGALWKTDFCLASQSNEHEASHLLVDFEWDKDVKNLAKGAKSMTEYIGPMGEREYIEVNLRSVFESLFNVRSGSINTKNPDAVDVTLEHLSFFWQGLDTPIEHMLTTFDMVFESGAEIRNSLRADFSLSSTLNTAQDIAALFNERISFRGLAAASRWHMDLAVLPSYMIPDIVGAAQNLPVDLALSRHVYAPHSFVKGTPDDHKRDYSEELAMATKAMSLSVPEPLPIQFGFLRPAEKVPCKEEEKVHSNEALDLPLGVRSLLSDWKVGANPLQYIHKDHYNGYDVSLMPAIDGNNRRNQHSQVSQPSVLPCLPSSLFLSSALSEGFMVQSAEYSAMVHDAPHRYNPFFRPEIDSDFLESRLSSQQFLGPSSQAVPDPSVHGNKYPSTAKKRIEKKRMGGF